MLAVFPFSRLIHILTYPFAYLVRPWQIVIWNQKVRRAEKVLRKQAE
jgi:nitrate reductase gamma subunit